MGVRVDPQRDAPGLGSPVYWATLGLIIEQPSYGYELVQRYERRFGSLLPLSSPGQIYKGLDALAQKALIERLPEVGGGRQPKPHYRASAVGLRTYQERLMAQAVEDLRRSRMLGLELAALPPAAALTALDGYEQACLTDARRTRSRPTITEADGVMRLASRLSAEEIRLTAQGRLSWIEYARRELKASLEATDEDS